MSPQRNRVTPGVPDNSESTGVAFFLYLLASPAVFVLVHLLLLFVCRPTWNSGEYPQCSADGVSQLVPPGITLAVIVFQTMLFHLLKVSEFLYWWGVLIATWLLVFVIALVLTPAGELAPIEMIWYSTVVATIVATISYPFRVASRPARKASEQAREQERMKLAAQAEKAEQQKLERQKKHKPTSDVIRWGLADVFSGLGAVDTESGLLVPELNLECPRCLGMVTVNDTLSAIYSVEKALKPKHKNWLAASRSAEPRYKGTDLNLDGQLRAAAKPIYAPSALQESLACTALEAKSYLAATEKLGLFGSGTPACEDCVKGRSRATGRRPMSPRLRRDVLMRDRFTCQECGANRGDDPDVILHVDHIQPVAAGGQDEMDNLHVLCIDCNLGKSDDRSYM